MSRFETHLRVALALLTGWAAGCHVDDGNPDDSQDESCAQEGPDERCCDGLSNEDDEDGDNLSTWDECYYYGTSDVGDDSDGNGIPDGYDSDGDGLSDGYEVTQGSDPDDDCSTETPYEGGWSRFSCCGDIEATEVDSDEVPGDGDVPPDFSGDSQYDRSVELYSFCKYPAVLIMSSYDNEAVEFSTQGPIYEGLFEQYHHDGLMVVLFLKAGEDGSSPDAEDVDDVVARYSLTYPVILLSDSTEVQKWTNIPRPGTYALMGEDLVLKKDVSTEPVEEDEVRTLLGLR